MDDIRIPNKVIIWGKDGYNPLGLLKQLHGFAEVVFLLYGKPKMCALKSRYCTTFHRTNSLEEGLNWLLENYKSEESKPFILTTGDIVAEFVDQNKKVLEEFFYLTGTQESGLLTRVLDKNYMNHLANDCGFLLPKSRECRWDSDISDVEYPCILKPDKNRRDHTKVFKTMVCENREQLIHVLDKVSHDSCFVLQQYIPKQYDALVYGCRTNNDNVVLPGVLMKNRWDIGGDGVHGYLSDNIPQSISRDAIEKFLAKIDYHGVFSVEYGIDSNKAYFYEFNLRNDGTSHYFFQAGVNIPLLWLLTTLNLDISDYPHKIDGYHDYIAIVDDLVNVISGNISLKQWKLDKKKATVFRYYDKSDMRPFYYNAVVVVLRPIRKALLKLKSKIVG